MTREEARILISHATATWLGLVKVLCPNKAPRIKRQVASVSKKATEPPKSSNSNSLSGSQHPPKAKNTGTVTVKDQQYELPTSKPRSHKKRRRRGRPAHREEEDQVDNRSGKSQTSHTNNGKATDLGGRQSVLPRRISTPSQSEIKSVSNNRHVVLLPGSQHPPKVKIQVFCQNVNTTSHRMMKIHTTSTLRAISSATKTHKP